MDQWLHVFHLIATSTHTGMHCMKQTGNGLSWKSRMSVPVLTFFLQWSSCAHSAVVGCLGHKPQNTDRLFGRHWWNPWPCSSSTLVHVLPRGFTASHCHHSVRCLNKALAGRGKNYSMERMKNIPWKKWYSLFESNWCYITLLECIYMYHNLSFMTRKLATFPLSREK